MINSATVSMIICFMIVYICYELADAYRHLCDGKLALEYCERTMALKPGFAAAKTLLEELKRVEIRMP